MGLRRLQHRGQTFTYTDRAMRFPAAATRELLDILHRWQMIFPREETLVQKRCGVPSLFVRFDCVINTDGTLGIYELQDGCAWIGYTGVANGEFSAIRDVVVKNEWPGLKAVISQQEHNTDDELWLERVNVPQALQNDCPLMVRSKLSLRTKVEQTALIRRSVRPVLMHNDKEYGITLGWWKGVTWDDNARNELPWNEPFVLKPLDGHGSIDIMLWNPHERSGRSTRTQILRVFAERGKMLLQPFYPPMRMALNDAIFNVIYRPYFMYSIARGGWIPMHGVWTARPYPAIRIHGASDTISGPLMMD